MGTVMASAGQNKKELQKGSQRLPWWMQKKMMAKVAWMKMTRSQEEWKPRVSA